MDLFYRKLDLKGSLLCSLYSSFGLLKLYYSKSVPESISSTSYKIQEPEIEFKDVNFACSLYPVIKNVSFEIKKGEKVAIIGDNGCGKSTLLKFILIFCDIGGR